MSIQSKFFKSWRLGPAVVVVLTSMAAAAQTAATSNPCATGSASLPGQSGGTFGSPFDVLMKASTGSGCNLTELRLYVDNKTYQSIAVNQTGAGGYDFKPINLSDGYHTFVGVAWNRDGYAFVTNALTEFVGNENQTVYIVSPADNARLTNSTVHFDIHTRWDIPGQTNYGTQVTHVRVYVDNKDIYDTNSNHVDFYKTLTPGGHYVVAIAWNQSGNYIKSSSSFIVQ